MAVLGLLLMAFIAGIVILMTKGDERAMKFVNAVGTKLRFLHPETLPKFFGQLVARFKQLSTDRRQLAKAVFFASANWLFDAASLFVFVGAFGRWVDPVALLVAYGVANIAAAIPFTPGGLGVLELTLIGILVGFGPPRAIVIWGVVAWRLVNFWLPIPVGGSATCRCVSTRPPATRPAWRSAGPCGAPAGAGSSSCSGRKRQPGSPTSGGSVDHRHGRAQRRPVVPGAPLDPDAPLARSPPASPTPRATRTPRSPRTPRSSPTAPPRPPSSP